MNKVMFKRIILILLSLLLTIQGFPQNDEWNISTTNNKNYTGIVVANGRLGILSSQKLFTMESVILNNVYDNDSPLDVSKILKGMNFVGVDVEINGEKVTVDAISNWRQTLAMKEAKFTTSFDYKKLASISYDVYALRNLPYVAFMDIRIKAKEDLKVRVTGKIVTPEEYKQPRDTFMVLTDLETTMPFLETVARSRQGRHVVATAATFIWHDIVSTHKSERPELINSKPSPYDNRLTFERSLKTNSTLDFTWAGSECTTQDFFDPKSESERFIIYSLLTPHDELLSQHKALWDRLWQGDIEINGDLASQQDVRLALYHLYSFGRAGTNLSISPMGLSSQGYNGHIFWDSELWMFPPMLILNQDIARSMINYRSDKLDIAKKKASRFGYEGAMFPWESDDTGEECTPPFALTGPFEHHITADIGIATWNFYRVTRDKKWLTERGYPMLKEIADFWITRAAQNSDGSYSVKNVVGANEFAQNIDDNAFTNGSAITALKYAGLAARELGLASNPDWEKVGNKIRILHLADGTTKENSRYNGEVIKQADANLLAYPLEIVNTKEAVLRDLRYYEPKLSPEGPAMGKSVFALIYARMGDAENAYRLFRESFTPNKRPPFGALSESATSNNPYFATGAGGMLQTVLFGFGGLHITENGIVQINPILPAKWKSLVIRGVGPEKKTYTVKKD